MPILLCGLSEPTRNIHMNQALSAHCLAFKRTLFPSRTSETASDIRDEFVVAISFYFAKHPAFTQCRMED